MRPLIGRALIAVGVVHTITTPGWYGGGLDEIVDDGVIGAAPDSPGVPDAAFWYLSVGMALLLLAVLVHWAERRGDLSLRSLGWQLIGLGAFGALIEPASPFWGFIILGAIVVARAGRAEPATPFAGRVLAAVGILHLLAAVPSHGDGLSEILDDGVIAAAPDVPDDPDAAFWYLIGGFFMIIAGALIHRVELTGRVPYIPIAWGLVAVGTFGIILKGSVPYLVFPAIAVIAFRRARATSSSATPSTAAPSQLVR